MTDMKPCLRCGCSYDEVVTQPEWDEENERLIGHWLICECGLSIWGEDEDDAKQRWNTRPAEDELRARAEAAEAKWASVPWADCQETVLIADEADRGSAQAQTLERVQAWLAATAPQEPQP